MAPLFDLGSLKRRNGVIQATAKQAISATTKEASPVSAETSAKRFRRCSAGAMPNSMLEDEVQAPEKFTDWFIHSHHMDRYAMFVAWFCFFQTSLQFMSCFASYSLYADSFYDGRIHIMANVFYTIFYASFLGLFWQMEPAQLPAKSYIIGVFFYTVGYIAFALMAMHAHKPYTHTDEDVLKPIFYTIGSWCFVTGSALLCYALKPGDEDVKDLVRFPGLDGSVCFLVGSFVFAADAAGFEVFHGLDGVVGYAIFLAGRVFFVQASVTDWCTIFFQRKAVDDSYVPAPN